MVAPELLESNEDIGLGDGDETGLLPAEIRARAAEKRIEELEQALLDLRSKASTPTARGAVGGLIGVPDDPDALVSVNIPPGPTGFPVTINGKPYIGKKTVKRRVLDQIMSMLSYKGLIERERFMHRGSQVDPSQLDPSDVMTRVTLRRGPLVVP